MHGSMRKRFSVQVLLAYPALKKSRNPPSLRGARKKLRKYKGQIDQILEKVENMLAALSVPTPGEYKQMISGEAPFTPEALLLGTLNVLVYHLEETSYDLDGYFSHSAADLKSRHIDRHLLARLGLLIAQKR